MGNLQPRSKIIWTLAATSSGSTLSATGNSGNWESNASGAGGWPPVVSERTPVDLREISDVALMVSVGGITSTPALTVNLDVYDDQGNLYPAVLTSGAISAAGVKSVSGGLHGGSAGSYLVLPDWGRVSWTVTGGTVTGTQIVLYGR
jgi:hypothetical protein